MEESTSGFKLLLSYELNTNDLQEYYQFVMGRYVPAMQEIGWQMSEAWHTAYGDSPNRLIGFVCENRQIVDDLLENKNWSELNQQLEQYVTDFKYKVIPYRGGFQI
jgi:hypothetical protein